MLLSGLSNQSGGSKLDRQQIIISGVVIWFVCLAYLPVMFND